MLIKKTWIYDLETLDIFTATFEDKDSNDIRQFVISNKRDNKKELFNFLNNEVLGLIGYNCINFDAQILEYLYKYPNSKAFDIKIYVNYIISNNKFPDVPEWKLKIPHLDLFHALSLSTKAKRTSLKWCEFSMDLDNIEDLPENEENNWEEKVLSYNYNDVYATKQLYLRYYKEIELRKAIGKREGINLLNSTEPNISKKLFIKWLSKEMNISEKTFKNMRGVDRDFVKISDILLPYISFETNELKSIYAKYSQTILSETDKFEEEIIFGGISTVYGLGGVHGSIKNEVIESNDEYIIKSADVKSYYPNLAIKNGFHPAHLPKEVFGKLYEGLYNERISIPKTDPRNYILKICLNSLYGLTNDKFSPFRDRQYTLTICINGQLLLSMLFEQILLQIPNSRLLMINTDGGEVLIPRKYEETYSQICSHWENITKLTLEYDNYQKLIVKDVNNYIGLFTNSKTKCKGMFEFENIPLHKNKSFSIIPKAIFNYFIHNTSVEETIMKERNIFEFCGGVRAKFSNIKGNSWYELHSIQDSNLLREKLSKTVRYFISEKGKYLMKCYEDNSIAHVEAPLKRKRIKKEWKVTYFNRAFYPDNFEEYGIDYIYYIHKAKSIINELNSKQANTLF